MRLVNGAVRRKCLVSEKVPWYNIMYTKMAHFFVSHV